MSKLHEILAVEADLEGKAKVVINEATKVFKEKAALFVGFVRTYKPFVEEGSISYPEENQEMTTTVPDKLNYISKSIASWFDVIGQKEATNQIASADIIVNGETLVTKVPATLLLGLESRLKVVRDVYANIPTLPMGTEWRLDDTKGKNIYSMVHPEEVLKTAKTMKSKVLHPAQFPKENEGGQSIPAVIDKWDETENVGKYTKQVWSGMITPARKSELLERIDELIRAVKMARQRANSVDVVKINVGKSLMDYINK